MKTARRLFLAQLLSLAAIPRSFAAMHHTVLLGDSIFDNGSYTGGGPDVITQLREFLPSGSDATLLAVDGATTRGIPDQLQRLPKSASHLVLSVGGNDALGAQHILRSPVKTIGDGLLVLAGTVAEFEQRYRSAVAACRRPGLPLTLCTIYNGNFPEPAYRIQVAAAIATFNDAILRVGRENMLAVIDLRAVCDKPEDYANPIEPSSIGGAKIARAIVDVVTRSMGQRESSTVIGRVRRS